MGWDERELNSSERVTTIDGKLWGVVLHWAEIDGRAEVAGIELWGTQPFRNNDRCLLRSDGPIPYGGLSWPPEQPQPVSATVLKGLRLGDIIASAAAGMRKNAAGMDALAARGAAPAELGEEAAKQVELLDSRKRPGRPSKGLAFYREVADVYLNPPDNRTPTRAVAQHFKVVASTAATYVGGARRRGLLPPARPGSASVISPEQVARARGERQEHTSDESGAQE